MQWPDAVNGLFELFGGAFILLSIRQVVRDKAVKGVCWWHVSFFSVWGVWNLYFYPWAGAWFSFVGGIGITAANTAWLCLLFYYSRENLGDQASNE